MKRVVLLDDDKEILECLKYELEQCQFKVFAFADPLCALINIPTIEPELVVLDWNMPKLSGIEVLEQLGYLRVAPVVVMLTGWEDAEMATAFKSKVHAFIRKPARVYDILAVFARFSNISQKDQRDLSTLSKREQEIFALVSSGLRSGEIAKRCFISKRTVEKHRENIKRRLEQKPGSDQQLSVN